MSQVNIIKSRIIDVSWNAAPPASRSNGQRSVTVPILPLPEPEPPREVITTLALASPVMVIEDVQPEPPLDPRLILLREPTSERAHSFRLLQHRLFSQHDPRSILVTSAAPGEGKTTCALNLALALAEGTSARVLLVDANLSCPAIAEVFRFEPIDSLMTKLLRNEDSAPPYAVASLSFSRLQLAALHPEVARDKRLDRALFHGVLRALRESYDYIVVDSSAVLESADANIASQCVDATLLSLRAGQSHKRELRRALDHLSPANVVGAVLLEI
jgi:Mrp family chromosome partitioning ATPase